MRVVRSVSARRGFNIGMNQGARRRRRHRRPPAPARRAALGGRPELHADHRPDQDPARAARDTRAAAGGRRGRSERTRRARGPAGRATPERLPSGCGPRASGHTKTSVSDVVTAADHRRWRLASGRHPRRARPEDGVLGEEGAAGPAPAAATWVIDPVDGTYNFLAGLDWWCSAIALTDGDDLVLGARAPPGDRPDVRRWPGPRAHPRRRTARRLRRPAPRGVVPHDVPAPAFRGGEVRRGVERPDGERCRGTIRMNGSGSMDALAVAAGAAARAVPALRPAVGRAARRRDHPGRRGSHPQGRCGRRRVVRRRRTDRRRRGLRRARGLGP